jgi:hypothetical protein
MPEPSRPAGASKPMALLVMLELLIKRYVNIEVSLDPPLFLCFNIEQFALIVVERLRSSFRVLI